MKRALLTALALCACSLRAPRGPSTPCATTAQCDRPDVCFIGECRAPSAALTVVQAEVRPANDSPLGVAQVGGIDLHLSAVHDFALVQAFVGTGTVMQAQDASAAPVPVSGATVTFTDHTPAIPDRVEQVVARTDLNGGFSVRLPQGQWDVLVQPPAPLPPFRAAQPFDTSAPSLALTLPRVGALAQFQGALTADGGPLTGANVTAVDSSGNALSAPAAVQADGGFSLYLPPGTDAGYFLQVGPPAADADAGLAAAVLDPLPNYEKLTPTLPAVDVALPAAAALKGTVTDSGGLPVGGARVYARSDGMPWTLSRSAVTGADGAWSISLRAGNYVVEAAPGGGADAPAVSGEIPVIVPAAGASVDIVCPPKVRGFGLVVRPEGGAVGANYQITATRVADRLLTARTATASATDTGGIWHVVADPGRYRVEVVPTADSGYPRKVVQLDLPTATSSVELTLPQITLSPPLVVGGVVGAAPDASKAPATNATVTFYALDANGHGVLLGSASTDDKGQYKAVLPDVAQPGAALHGY